MKKYKNILYLVDNNIYLYNSKYKDIINENISKKIIKYGKIINIKLFIEEMKEIIKKYNLNTNIFGDTIHIITNLEYNLVDKDIIINIFSHLNYRKVYLISEFKILNLNNTNAYLNYNKDYAFLYYINYFQKKEGYFIPLKLVDIDDLKKIIAKKIEKRDLFVFGTNHLIDEFCNDYEKKYNRCYHYLSDEKFLIELLLK